MSLLLSWLGVVSSDELSSGVVSVDGVSLGTSGVVSTDGISFLPVLPLIPGLFIENPPPFDELQVLSFLVLAFQHAGLSAPVHAASTSKDALSRIIFFIMFSTPLVDVQIHLDISLPSLYHPSLQDPKGYL
jgi:hypothetical protein